MTAGTSDIPVAEEAVVTCEMLGNETERVYDVGVAGLHRLFGEFDRIKEARVVITVAGMEGALPSVVAGLVRVPVVAVPTSVGYGASFKGLAALLAMLNSCPGGVGRGQYRQRLRRRLPGQPDQPPVTGGPGSLDKVRIDSLYSIGTVLTII